jgi:uncharacterized protein
MSEAAQPGRPFPARRIWSLQRSLLHSGMFEWDEDKNRQNLAKHGIAFEDVLPVFASRKTLSLEDRLRDNGEPRYVVLCPLGDVLVHVTYPVRGGSIRLISTRRASRREKRDDALRKPHSGGADPGRPCAD